MPITVLSNQLFNLQLSKQHKGAAKDTTHTGTLYSIIGLDQSILTMVIGVLPR